MALTPAQVSDRYGVIRTFLAAVGVNQVMGHAAAADSLERLLRELAAAIAAIELPEDEDGEPVDLTEILTRLAAVETLSAEALRTAVSMHLLDMVPLTAEEILAVVDRYIDTEAGDHLLTEDGDALLLESA